MRLRTLGGLSLEGSEFTRPKPLLLLAHLAVEGPQRRRHLAELFWPHAADHMKSLTVALARLRHGAPGAIGADERSAWATVGSDAGAFAELLERGAPDEALALYGGPFLDGVRLRGWGPELEEWVYRTREFFASRAYHAHLHLAEEEARAGRFTRASRRGEEARRVAGATPEPEDLRRLHAVLLAGRSPLAFDVRREAEDLDVAVVRSADEARRRLRHPPAGSPAAALQALPKRSTGFVGRNEEVARVSNSLAEGGDRLVTVVGPAGVGKSRLALQVGWRHLGGGRFPHGIGLVPLESTTMPGSLLPAIADAAGESASDAGDPLERLVGALGDSRRLLILDGCEHLTGAAAHLSALLRRCPQLCLLVTSRERLNVEEERIVPLAGLPFPSHAPSSPAAALRFDAVQLFVRRARRADPDFALDGGNVDDVVRVCRLLEGVPLGLELAAAWARVLPPREIATEIERNLDFLTARGRDVPRRHRSLRGAFEHSWRLLPGPEQDALARLSVFHGGFRREAALAVAGVTVPVLASLVDKSLLRVDRSGRYDRQPLVYRYTREKLHDRPRRRAEVEARHARHVLVEAPRVGAPAEEEAENVRAAWRRAVDGPWTELLWEGTAMLKRFYLLRPGLTREGSTAFEAAAARLDRRDPRQAAVRARLLVAAAWFRFLLGDHARSDRAAREGVDGLRAWPGAEPGDRARLLRAIACGGNTRGHVAHVKGRADRAERAFLDALGVARDGDDRPQAAVLAHNLALLRLASGRLQEAEALCVEALAVHGGAGDDRAAARCLALRGAIMGAAGDLAGARTLLDEALVRARAAGFERLAAVLLAALAETLGGGRRGDRARLHGAPEGAVWRALSPHEAALRAPALL